MKSILFLDVDDVCFPLMKLLLHYVGGRQGRFLPFDDVRRYDLSVDFGMDSEEGLRLFSEFMSSAAAAEAEPIPGTHKALSALAKRYRLVAVTAMPVTFRCQRARWFREMLPGLIEEILYSFNRFQDSGSELDKAEIVQQRGAVGLVDDSLEQVFACARAGVPAYLFGEYPWNERKYLPLDVTRTPTWDDVLAALL